MRLVTVDLVRVWLSLDNQQSTVHGVHLHNGGTAQLPYDPSVVMLTNAARVYELLEPERPFDIWRDEPDGSYVFGVDQYE